MEGGGKIYEEDRGSNGEERSANMGIRGRKEGGEGDPFYLRVLEKLWESRAAKKGFCWRLFFLLRGYKSLGLVLGLGSGVQRGTFGAGWSARPRQLAGWQDWFGLVEFQNLGRTFGCRKKARKNGKRRQQQRWIY